MNKPDLIEIRGRLEEEVSRRRRLGGFSTDAEGILLIAEALLAIADLLIAESQKKKRIKK